MTLRKAFGFATLAALMSCCMVMSAQERPAPPTKNPPLFKGDKPKKDDGTRLLSGVVRDADEKLLENAVVKLKDTKTLAIRSYITKADGAYSFQGLSVGTDYEVRAEGKDGSSSPVKILSVFDNRREPVMNLKVEPKK